MKQYVLVCLFVVSPITGAALAQPVAPIPPKLTVVWGDRSINEEGFALERGTQQAGPFTEITSTAMNVATYDDLTVASNTTYCYRVRAWNTKTTPQTERQYSSYSPVACGSVVPPPETPGDILLSAQQDLGNAQAQLGMASGKIARALEAMGNAP